MLAKSIISDLENYLRNSVMREIFNALDESRKTGDFMVQGGVEQGRFLGEYLHVKLFIRRNSVHANTNASPINKYVTVAVFELLEGSFHVVCRAVNPGQELPSRSQDEFRFKVSTKADIENISDDLRKSIRTLLVHAWRTKVSL